MTRDQLLSEHNQLSIDLAAEQRLLGRLLGQERRAKTNTWLEANGSDKLRDNAAQMHTMDITEEVFRARHNIQAMTAELENLRLQLHFGGFTEE